VKKVGSFLVESDLAGNSLCERETPRSRPDSTGITRTPGRQRRGRCGETDDKTEDVI
jgi:hypothetical protein